MLIDFFEEADRGPRGELLRAIWRKLRHSLSLHPDSASSSHAPEKTLHEVILLETLYFGQLAGLLVYIQRDPVFDLKVAMFYLGIAVLPTLGFLAIALSFQRVGDQREYTYSLPIRRVSLIAFWAAFVITPMIALAYYANLLPGQWRATVISVHPIRINDNEKGRMALVKLETPKPRAGPLERSWEARAFLTGKTNSHWEIADIVAKLDAELKKPWEGHLYRTSFAEAPWQKNGGGWEGTIDNATPGVYWLGIVLSQRQNAEEDNRDPIPTEEVTFKLIPK